MADVKAAARARALAAEMIVANCDRDVPLDVQLFAYLEAAVRLMSVCAYAGQFGRLARLFQRTLTDRLRKDPRAAELAHGEIGTESHG